MPELSRIVKMETNSTRLLAHGSGLPIHRLERIEHSDTLWAEALAQVIPDENYHLARFVGNNRGKHVRKQVQPIIRRVGGKILARAHPAAGASFYFTLGKAH
jgi:hypothetical protein